MLLNVFLTYDHLLPPPGGYHVKIHKGILFTDFGKANLIFVCTFRYWYV